MAIASENRTPFLCALGWHRPRPLARWNNGYYFTKCSRCGRDLVRTAYGGWREPQGFRVVWQAHAPANSNAGAALVREREDEIASSELPIQEVLRHLQNGNAETAVEEPEDALPAEADNEPPPRADEEPSEAIEVAEPPANEDPAEAAKASRAFASIIPDFMEDANTGQLPPRTYVTGPARIAPERGDDYLPEERDPGVFSRLRMRVAEMTERRLSPEENSGPGLLERSKLRFADLLQRFRRSAQHTGEDEAVAESSPVTEIEEERPPRDMHPAFVMAIPIALLLVVLAGLVLWGRIGGQPVETNVQQATPLSPDQGQPAFVTASVLNCRTSPSRQAESVAVLVRGDPVRLLARDGEWISLVHEGGQCWALSRYFAIQAPM